MPLIPVNCVTLACDLCAQELEAEYCVLHFDGENDARTAAQSDGWLVTAEGRVICTSDDAAHRQAVDDLLPAAPQPGPGQLALGETQPHEGR